MKKFNYQENLNSKLISMSPSYRRHRKDETTSHILSSESWGNIRHNYLDWESTPTTTMTTTTTTTPMMMRIRHPRKGEYMNDKITKTRITKAHHRDTSCITSNLVWIHITSSLIYFIDTCIKLYIYIYQYHYYFENISLVRITHNQLQQTYSFKYMYFKFE